MKRVASLYLPSLGIDRLRRAERALRPNPFSSQTEREEPAWVPAARLPENAKERARLAALRDRLEQEADGDRIEDCSCPRGGGWRPGSRWANRKDTEATIDALPAHQRPPMRMLGRRSEAAETPFRGRHVDGEGLVESQAPAPQWQHGPLATTQRVGQRVVLAAVSHEAAALGLRPGMAVTQARALVPALDLRDADAKADTAVLTRLALFAARRWTPIAAISGPDGLWLDLSGVSHLLGGERRMCERILRVSARLGFDARISVAGTTGAAHALARFGPGTINLCPNGQETQAIAPLAPEALRLDGRAVNACRRFGIETIGELAALARGPLARRFGNGLLLRLDQAYGRAGEPFDPIVPQEPPRATLRFLEPIGSAEAIQQVIGDLIDKLIGLLERQGLAARRLSLICDGVSGGEQRLDVGMASASRDARHLLHLFKMKVEAIEPGFGIEAMHLVARRCEPWRPRQIDSDAAAAELPPLIDRIASRIGPSHVFRCSAVESDVPERSVRRVPPLAETHGWPLDWPRPTRLLPHPEPVDKVIAELPDQPPVRFSWRGTMHRVRKADGPERIYGEWWRHVGEAESVRDYFQVEDDSGARFWLFRRGDGVDPRTGNHGWYIHGLFA